MSSQVCFTLRHTDPGSAARAGVLHTAHGDVPTPIFMPVGTQATVKTVPQHILHQDVGAPLILGNNYHLYLRPGHDLLAQAGGLHRFMAWPGALLTDSGGYQVYSLAHIRKLREEGVEFRSHIDGSQHLFTPENVVLMQRQSGPDIQMVLDECPPYPADRDYATQSLGLTHRWAARARQAFLTSEPRHGYPQLQFGILQGSTYEDLRRQSAQTIAELDFEGNAIGGLSVGEPTEMLYDLTELCCQNLPASKPRYLMGVGTPANLLACILRGVDMFDCVLPSRNARHGMVYTWQGIRNLKNAKYARNFEPLDTDAHCPYDTQYSHAYLRHLFQADESLAAHIATVHNLSFYLRLVTEARRRILDGSFAAWATATIPQLEQRI